MDKNKDFMGSELLGLSKLVMEAIVIKIGEPSSDMEDLMKQTKVLLEKIEDLFDVARISLVNKKGAGVVKERDQLHVEDIKEPAKWIGGII